MQLPQGNSPKGPVDAPNPSYAPTLARFWVRAFLGVALVSVLATFAGLSAWLAQERSIADQHLSAWTEATVRSVANRMSTVQSLLREWASDPSLRAVFRTMDAAEMRAKEEAMARQVPEALSIRLVAPNRAGILDGNGPFMSYASLDLMRRAMQERKMSPLEVHRVAHPDMHLAIAGPVLDDQSGQALGVVHVALPLSLLPPLGETGGTAGQLFYQQRVGSDMVTLSQGRTAPSPDRPPKHFMEIPGTSLRVSTWPTEIGLFDNSAAILALLSCTLALMGLALWIPYRGLKAALVADHAGLVALVEDGVTQRPLHRLKCRLAETSLLQERLYPLFAAIGAQSAHWAATSAQLDQGPPGHAFTLDVGETVVPPPSSYVLPEEEPDERPSIVQGSDRPDVRTGPAEPRNGAVDSDSSVGHLAIFGAYDVRGVVGKGVDEGIMGAIGQAVAREVAELGDRSVLVARDTRTSSAALTKALITGLRVGGCDVLDLGVAPTPLLYFATRYQGDVSGVMVTASHNPPEYNGCKIVLAGQSIGSDRMQAIERRVIHPDVPVGPSGDYYEPRDLTAAYIDHVERDVTVARGLKLVVDCGNGAAALLAPAVYRALGCEVIELHCDPQGGFPDGRVSDPSRADNVRDLIEAVNGVGADLGLGFDGDGDRLGVVDSAGRFIAMDRVLMLFAADVLSRHPGTDIVFDVKCTHLLAAEILSCGGRPVMSQSGHSRLKAKLRECGALLAGELSGHVIFQERWFGFDDAVYAGARLIELLALDPRTTAEVFATLPEAIGTPELLLPMQEGEPQQIVERILGMADRLEGVTVTTVDGLRAGFDGGWGLVRASNTQPALSFRFQGDDQESLRRIQELFRQLIERAAPDLALPF